MPIVVRPEDIKLPEGELKKDLLYSLGLEEGKQLGLEEGLLRDAQDVVLTVIRSKIGYIPEGVEHKVRQIKDRSYLHSLIEKLVIAEDASELLKRELEVR